MLRLVGGGCARVCLSARARLLLRGRRGSEGARGRWLWWWCGGTQGIVLSRALPLVRLRGSIAMQGAGQGESSGSSASLCCVCVVSARVGERAFRGRRWCSSGASTKNLAFSPPRFFSAPPNSNLTSTHHHHIDPHNLDLCCTSFCASARAKTTTLSSPTDPPKQGVPLPPARPPLSRPHT